MTKGITIIKRPQVIQVKSAFPIFPEFQNFSEVATENDQTIFTLPANPILTGLSSFNINGVVQDPLNGDYTISGNTLTLNPGINIGDKVAGFFQVMSQISNPTVNNYRTFFLVATQGQTQFNIGFVPTAVIYIAINGIIQSQGDGDFTVNGQIITTSQGLDDGDKFFGLAIQ